jgi:mannose-1-phosphate guanylyltransferase/mannose-1-phosphate guanylyltransferase/phosphomannomutase
MKAIILAAGKGTRVQGINDEVPKVLLEILGKPMLLWNIEQLKKYGISNIAINTHHLSNKIKDYLGNGNNYGVNLIYSYESELLGTSGALNNFRDFFNETFFVVYGDVISQLNLDNLIKFHKSKKSSTTLVVHKTDHPEDSDIVEVDNDSKIIKLYHKPGLKIPDAMGTMGSAAFYILEPIVLKYIPNGTSDFVKDIFPKMLENKERLYAYNTTEFIKDAGTPNRIKQVEEFLTKTIIKH